jgi:ATPase subunit of ABC transporter with duplicated ATPase domains
MAQSRRRKLEKMEVIEKPQQVVKPTFAFKYTQIFPKIILRVKNLEVGYGEPLLPKINLTMRAGEKLCISGFNGIGKTTFIKTMAGMLPKISGTAKWDDDVEVGYYEQENVWEDPSRTAFDEIREAFPKLKDRDVRGNLAKCGLKAEQAMQSVSTLSGGEQAKVKLCKLVLQPCNLLMLDEPTNHLDVNAIAQLESAILAFSGAVLFVSHNKVFCEEIADRVLNLEALFD